MAITTSSLTLEEKVLATLHAEKGPIESASTHPRLRDDEHLSTYELDLRDWGVTYGIAFGIARTEDPFETMEDVGERALKAAWPAYNEFAGGFENPDRDFLIGEVVRALNSLSAQEHGALRDLSLPLADALVRLSNGAGS